MSGFFITATGTDIGKTFVTAGLVRALRRAGRGVAALKPVLSGFDPAAAADSDPGKLLVALGRAVTPDSVAEIAPWRFRVPLSPDMAARLEGRRVDVDAVIGFCRARLAASEDVVLIEGVGGVMVPLDDRRTVLTWMVAMNLPAVLVCGSYLGAISHTLTALDVLLRHRIPVAAMVISETPGSSVPLPDTVATITRFAETVPVAALPRDADAAAVGSRFDELAGMLSTPSIG
jgi:dethiobiotin synthetase